MFDGKAPFDSYFIFLFIHKSRSGTHIAFPMVHTTACTTATVDHGRQYVKRLLVHFINLISAKVNKCLPELQIKCVNFFENLFKVLFRRQNEEDYFCFFLIKEAIDKKLLNRKATKHLFTSGLANQLN